MIYQQTSKPANQTNSTPTPRFDGPASQSDALENVSLVFSSAAELTGTLMMDGEPLKVREAIEAALYDLRPTPDEQREIWALCRTLVDIMDGFAAVRMVA